MLCTTAMIYEKDYCTFIGSFSTVQLDIKGMLSVHESELQL